MVSRLPGLGGLQHPLRRRLAGKLNFLFSRSIALFAILAGCSSVRGPSFADLPPAVDEIYPIWKINGSLFNNEGMADREAHFNILYSDAHPDEMAIENWEQVLNGASGQLLACRGRVFESGREGFVVGTSMEGPTWGRLLVYDGNLKLQASCDCQKVVRMTLVDMLHEGAQAIMTWEDHHYGTNTTRRVLNIYRISAAESLERIFDHDVMDARGDGPDLRYAVDLVSRRADRRIVVTGDDGVMKTFTWNGTRYAEEMPPR